MGRRAASPSARGTSAETTVAAGAAGRAQGARSAWRTSASTPAPTRGTEWSKDARARRRRSKPLSHGCSELRSPSRQATVTTAEAVSRVHGAAHRRIGARTRAPLRGGQAMVPSRPPTSIAGLRSSYDRKVNELCSCGEMQEPERIGWQPDGDGGVLLLVMCRTCRSMRVGERRGEATLCTACQGLLDTGDIKCCIADLGVFCTTCAQRSHSVAGTDWGRV